jgi:hypothetical protein
MHRFLLVSVPTDVVQSSKGSRSRKRDEAAFQKDRASQRVAV